MVLFSGGEHCCARSLVSLLGQTSKHRAAQVREGVSPRLRALVPAFTCKMTHFWKYYLRLVAPVADVMLHDQNIGPLPEATGQQSMQWWHCMVRFLVVVLPSGCLLTEVSCSHCRCCHSPNIHMCILWPRRRRHKSRYSIRC